MSHTNKELRAKFHTFFQNMKGDKYEYEIADWWLKEIAAREERLVEEIKKIKTYSHREFAESKVGLFVKLEDILSLITNQDTKSHE